MRSACEDAAAVFRRAHRPRRLRVRGRMRRTVAKAQASIRRLEAFTHQVLLGRPTKDSKTNRRISAQPNEMLGGRKPIEAIERGQIGLVWQVVEGLRSGAQL